MISGTKLTAALVFFLAAMPVAAVHAEEQQAGRFVQLRGNATIERGKSRLPARLKSGILASDVITTANASRAKLLFIDDSVLTMSDNSKLVVKEFIYSKGEQGKSVFNLLDGKMRSVVGKTKFEVHTPTAVAAARGTVIYFDVGMRNNQSYSKIICLEGNVQIRNVATTVAGQVTLTPGTMVVVKANEPPPPPAPAPKAELDQARKATQSSSTNDSTTDSSTSSTTDSSTSSTTDSSTTSDSTSSTTGATSSDTSSSSSPSGSGSTSSGSSSSPPPASTPATTPVTAPVTPQIPSTPPIQQQPIFQPRKVNINIGLPGQ